MKSIFASTKIWLTNTRFRNRLLIFAVVGFVLGFGLRFLDILGGFTVISSFASLLSAIWLFLGALKRSPPKDTTTKPKRFHRTKKLIAVSVLAPIIFTATVATGVVSGEIVLPYSESELAEREAQRKLQEQQDRLRKAAEEAKLVAEAEAAAERDALAAKEQAQKTLEQQSKARAKELAELSKTNRLLYTRERCKDVVFGDADIFGITSYISMGKNEKSLFLETKSSTDQKGLEVYTCTYVSMQMSMGLMKSIGNTTALSGVRSWSEDGYNYEWTYHPSYGLNMIIRKEERCFFGICI